MRGCVGDERAVLLPPACRLLERQVQHATRLHAHLELDPHSHVHVHGHGLVQAHRKPFDERRMEGILGIFGY